MKKLKTKKKKNWKKEKILKRKDLVYKTNKYAYNLQQYKIIRSSAKNFFAGKITLDNADENQSDFLNKFREWR